MRQSFYHSRITPPFACPTIVLANSGLPVASASFAPSAFFVSSSSFVSALPLLELSTRTIYDASMCLGRDGIYVEQG